MEAQARVALSDTELRAPYSGVIASLDVRPGEAVEAGDKVTRLADISTWPVETEDLPEIEIVDVRRGASVTITFDAIPDLEIPGTVVRIKPYGIEKQGDMTYTVLIQPEEYDERLRWNMTAMVSIDSESGTE